MRNTKGVSEQLGMPHTTASGRLKKMLMFALAQELGRDVCYRCEKRITNCHEFTVDHKKPWLYSSNPLENFFDLENVAFSHSWCNSQAARRVKSVHPSAAHYHGGCRCDECKECERQRKYESRVRGKKWWELTY